MIEIEEVKTYGWEQAFRGMRNPKDSWRLSDSDFDFPSCQGCPHQDKDCNYIEHCIVLGKEDLRLGNLLANAGTDHGKFLRMITVYMDITAPLYWWKEYDTYKVGTVANSCSTMHRIHAKEFTPDDFSHEHLFNGFGEGMYKDQLRSTIDCLNQARKLFLKTKDKKYWWQMIQLLPTSYNQLRTVSLNYAVLRNMYHARRNHKLDEWHVFCEFIESLPYSELITGGE